MSACIYSYVWLKSESNIFVLNSDFASRCPPFRDDDEESVMTEKEDYDAAKFNPVFYGKMYSQVETDADPQALFDASTSHPSCVGYAFVDKPPQSPPPVPPTPPPKQTCKLPMPFFKIYVRWMIYQKYTICLLNIYKNTSRMPAF